jgi:Tol biopolymer transport system component
VKTQATTQGIGTVGKARSALLFTLVLGAVLSALVAMVGTMREAEAAGSAEKIVFVSARTTGKGVVNPTGDYEIFRMNPNGTGVRQLTFNDVYDSRPLLSPDGQKILYASQGAQASNPEGDQELYLMNASDGSAQKNLTNTGGIVNEGHPEFSTDGRKIAYMSEGEQEGNPQSDREVYVMNASDGSAKMNLSNNGEFVEDYDPHFSPDSTKVAYTSYGEQASNPEGDAEVYAVNTADGSDQKNLTNNGFLNWDQSAHFSPDGQTVAYTSDGEQASNPEGDAEVYAMNALDGSAKKNLTDNGINVGDLAHFARFSPDGQKVLYASGGVQTSNPEGDQELYAMNVSDGSAKKNLTNNGGGVDELYGVFSPDGQKVLYSSDGVQASNPEGETEVYVMNASDGSAKKNLSNNNVRDFYAEWGR